jgi:solute:Na+ symporter, SSS family
LSAADAVLFMLTTSLSQDLYRRFLAPAATEAQMLRVTRITAVVAGTLGVAVALVAANVITALKIFYTLMTVGLLVPVLAGLYVRRAGSTEAMGALVAGVGTVVLRQFGFGGTTFYGLTPAMAGLAAALAAFLLVLAAGAALKLGTRHPRST